MERKGEWQARHPQERPTSDFDWVQHDARMYMNGADMSTPFF